LDPRTSTDTALAPAILPTSSKRAVVSKGVYLRVTTPGWGRAHRVESAGLLRSVQGAGAEVLIAQTALLPE
jgi:hypothetical protein